jgi:hypothetical protein
MRFSSAAALLLAAVLATGCGGGGDSAAGFRGAEAEVAALVDELQSAGQGRDAEKICSEILSRELVEQLRTAGSDCVQEMTDAVQDADDYDLEVRDVAVTGDRATARVQQGADGPTATLEFVRESGGWRATSLGAA